MDWFSMTEPTTGFTACEARQVEAAAHQRIDVMRLQLEHFVVKQTWRVTGFLIGMRLGDANDGRRRKALHNMYAHRRYQNMSRREKTKLRRLLLDQRVAH